MGIKKKEKETKEINKKKNMSNSKEVWKEEQQFHGGQSWSLIDNYVSDFSVTTNFLGTPKKAIDAAVETMKNECLHYPAADFEPALSRMAEWLNVDKQRFTFGNGLSELIDIVTRMAPKGAWKGGPYSLEDGACLQYKEYERAAKANDRTILNNNDKDKQEQASIHALVNPSNPTGAYFELSDLKKYIEENVSSNSFVLIDESMLPWQGPDWKNHSLLSQSEWIANQLETRQVSVFVLHSWTKIWSCPGLRVGSIVTPDAAALRHLRRLQVPWSLNSAALKFLELVVEDVEYMQETWDKTTPWRQREIDELTKMFPKWKFYGESWISWIWIDTGSVETAEKAVQLAHDAGVPVRHAKQGYNAPRFIRIGIREPEYQDVLFNAWKTL